MVIWAEKLIKAFRDRGQLTANDLGKILGCLGPDAVTRIRSAGFVLYSRERIANPKQPTGRRGWKRFVKTYQLVQIPSRYRCPYDCRHCREIENGWAKAGG